MWGGKRMAKQLDSTTSIKSTQNNGIHGIHFSPLMTFSRLSRLATKWKPGLNNISGMDWTTSKSNHSNQQMLYKSSSLNLISGSAIIVGEKMTHISSEHCPTAIFPNLSSSFWHISHFRRTSILNRGASLALMGLKSTTRRTRAIGGGIHRINFLPDQRLYQWYVHPARLTSPIFRATSMPGCFISQLVIFEKLSTAHLKHSWLLVRLIPCHLKVPKTLMKLCIPRLELCCLNSGILTSLALAWNGIVQIDSSDNVTLFSLPGSGNIRNMSWLLKFHIAHACCVEFLKLRQWGIHLFDHSTTQETTIVTRSCWSTIILLLLTL